MTPPNQALTATVIVIGTPDRLWPAAEALQRRREEGMRVILIAQGDQPASPPPEAGDAILVSGLPAHYLDNAVAALRLSSLPAVVWWRDGEADALDDLAALADRLVLDTQNPVDAWRRAGKLFEQTALTDLRWAKLTRWRALLAHLFDLPQVLAASRTLTRLTIEAGDAHAGRLFAGWIASALNWGASVKIALNTVTPSNGVPLKSVLLEGSAVRISMSLRPSGTCLQADVEGAVEASRAVPLADPGLPALIGEELGVRTRDLAFERALLRAQEIAV